MRLIFQKKKPKAEQGLLLHGHQHQHRQNTYQRGNFNHQHSSQTRDVLGSGIRNWSSFYKCQRRSSPSYNIGRIRAPTAPHTNGNRQYHRHRLQQWHNKTKTHKSNGYPLLLDNNIKCNKGNLMCTGAQDTEISQIISQNIICRHITKKLAKYTFTLTNN
jgi:hypothetical protein